MKKVHYNVICVGAGGTGGNFVKEFARYLSFLKTDSSISLSLIDGDKVEESNCSRQPYGTEDIALNKAVSLIEAIEDAFHIENVYSYPVYINNMFELKTISNRHMSKTADSNVIILVGTVDNHRARQVMEEFFHSQSNIIYIDSANEFSVGEICIGARIKNRIIAPPRSYYFPDVLTDKSPSASEMSCGAVNISSPQHIATNLMAAHLLLAVCTNIISEGKLDCGIIYFESFQYFSRFVHYEETLNSDKQIEGTKGEVKVHEANTQKNR